MRATIARWLSSLHCLPHLLEVALQRAVVDQGAYLRQRAAQNRWVDPGLEHNFSAGQPIEPCLEFLHQRLIQGHRRDDLSLHSPRKRAHLVAEEPGNVGEVTETMAIDQK